MNIKLLGAHNCESLGTRMVSLLVDDRLVLDAGGLTSSLSLADQQKITTILLTHQHYDHIRDVPAIAMNFYLAGKSLNICCTPSVYQALANGLFSGQYYPDFFKRPTESPTLKYIALEPYGSQQIGGYDIKTVPVNHSVPTVGFEIGSAGGRTFFYTGDTGPGLIDCWRQISPRLLFIEVTTANSYQNSNSDSGHLTPDLLKQELISFGEIRGYLPKVVTVHMNPGLADEIKDEIAAVADDLGCEISPGFEGMQLTV